MRFSRKFRSAVSTRYCCSGDLPRTSGISRGCSIGATGPREVGGRDFFERRWRASNSSISRSSLASRSPKSFSGGSEVHSLSTYRPRTAPAIAPSRAPIATESFPTSQVYPRRESSGNPKIFASNARYSVEDSVSRLEVAVIDNYVGAILHCTSPRSFLVRSVRYRHDIQVAMLVHQSWLQQLMRIGRVLHDSVLYPEVALPKAPVKCATGLTANISVI